MAILRSDTSSQLIERLRWSESDAAESCRRAASVITGDPLTRGAVFAFALEHDEQAAAWEAITHARARAPSRRPKSELAWDERTAASPLAALGLLRKQAEIGVRQLGEAMERLPPSLGAVARAHRNTWLRHRAYLGARLAAFERLAMERPSSAPA